MDICDPKGRDCIERNFAKSFNCSTTCEGIYANVWWVANNIDEDIVKSGNAGEREPKKEMDDELQRRFAALERRLGKMENVGGERGEEMDKDKYKRLISEYQNFKTMNVRHFRLNSDAVLSDFGKS